MTEIRVPLDPMNPGQFFACCGLFDLLSPHGDEVLARFEAGEGTPRRANFVVKGISPDLDLTRVLSTLRNAGVVPLEGTEQSVAPIKLQTEGHAWILDWWLDEFWDKTTSLKCWAGQVNSATAISKLRELIEPETTIQQLLVTSAPTKSKLGIDARSAWNALDFGFSPDKHNRETATYPIVEILGCLGLQAFRPLLNQREGFYNLWLEDLPVLVARLAAFTPWPGLARFEYQFSIDKRGQSYKFFTFAKCNGKKQ